MFLYASVKCLHCCLLSWQCENLVEEFEDDVIRFYKSEEKASDIMQGFCVETTGYCVTDDVTDHLMATAQALLRGYEEATGHALDGFEGMFDFGLDLDPNDDIVFVMNDTQDEAKIEL